MTKRVEQTDSNQRGGGREITGKKGKSHQGTCIKDSWTKPKVGKIKGGRWWEVAQGKTVAGKWNNCAQTTINK